MGLIFLAIAILAIIGGFAVIFWARKGEPHNRGSMGCMAVALFVLGVSMLVWGLYWS